MLQPLWFPPAGAAAGGCQPGAPRLPLWHQTRAPKWCPKGNLPTNCSGGVDAHMRGVGQPLRSVRLLDGPSAKAQICRLQRELLSSRSTFSFTQVPARRREGWGGERYHELVQAPVFLSLQLQDENLDIILVGRQARISHRGYVHIRAQVALQLLLELPEFIRNSQRVVK